MRKGRRPAAVPAAVVNSALELERDIKQNIAASVPAGRTYRRTAIVRASSRRNSGLKLKKRGNNVIVGYNFHRASRIGQAPAIDSGRLLNSIRGIKTGPVNARVNVGVNYGQPLDDPAYLDRPFFFLRAELYRPRFYENIRKAYGFTD